MTALPRWRVVRCGTNVFGVIAVTQAMLSLLREAPAGRIVNVSTRLGSMTTITDPAFPQRAVGGVAYGPSKTRSTP